MTILVAFMLAAAPATVSVPVGPTVSAIVRHRADAKGIAAANRLMDATDYDRLMADTVETMITGQRAAVAQGLREKMGDDIDEELVVKLGQFIEREIRALFRDNDRPMRDAYATLYASYFTADELDRLAVMQADPLMRKSVRIMPSMLNEVMTLMRGITDKREPEMRDRMLKMIQEHIEGRDG